MACQEQVYAQGIFQIINVKKAAGNYIMIKNLIKTAYQKEGDILLKYYFKINVKNCCEVLRSVLTLSVTHEYLSMSELIEIVDSLENKISKLLHKLELLGIANERLEEELESLKDERDLAKNSVLLWEEKYESLKMANSMLGSDINKTEAKLKINTLIRELDHCIAQLSE